MGNNDHLRIAPPPPLLREDSVGASRRCRHVDFLVPFQHRSCGGE